MSGILGMLLAGGPTTSTFSITAGSITGSAPSGAGYNDHSAGTEGGSAAGSITGGTFVARHIAEIWSTNVTDDRLIVKGFSSDPGKSWLVSLHFPVTANAGPPVTLTGASATYSYDAVNGAAKWLWSPTALGIISGNTYNGNTITHGS